MLTIGPIVIRCGDLERQSMLRVTALDAWPRLPAAPGFAAQGAAA